MGLKTQELSGFRRENLLLNRRAEVLRTGKPFCPPELERPSPPTLTVQCSILARDPSDSSASPKSLAELRQSLASSPNRFRQYAVLRIPTCQILATLTPILGGQ
jgi:hypothetical protein